MVTTGAVVQSFGARIARILRDLTVQELKLSLQKQACINKLSLQKQVFCKLKISRQSRQIINKLQLI